MATVTGAVATVTGAVATERLQVQTFIFSGKDFCENRELSEKISSVKEQI